MTDDLDKLWEDWASELCIPIHDATTDALFELVQSFANLPADQRPRLQKAAVLYASFLGWDEATFLRAVRIWLNPGKRSYWQEAFARFDPNAWKRGLASS